MTCSAYEFREFKILYTFCLVYNLAILSIKNKTTHNFKKYLKTFLRQRKLLFTLNCLILLENSPEEKMYVHRPNVKVTHLRH